MIADLRLGHRLRLLEVVCERDDADGARARAAQHAARVLVHRAEVAQLRVAQSRQVDLAALERLLGVALGARVLAARGFPLKHDGHVLQAAAGHGLAHAKEVRLRIVEQREQVEAFGSPSAR